MPKYTVCVRERLARNVSVEAESEEEALEIIEEKYHSGEIVLDSEDYIETAFELKTP
ncbi:hypothetical protein Tfer_0867 [Thermincola ferriacetica]|uniref:DpnD/PcfM-like C-terminal domain-containing protein n=1 Tax=Thermincola ferriacetica TaxID=281456 RepID=A0A0L6W3Z9_9FIRM|nr:DpnD/PcfM family protein [Thermincola ferriacetica]KNZ70307.1 hypothetical protein Tfer_0867 [Thermincola ferriacetica]